jgi:hypothetical protein
VTDIAEQPPSFLQSIVASMARHGLTSAAGALVTFGVFKATQTSEFVDLGVSVALWGFAMWWSAIQKKNAAKG